MPLEPYQRKTHGINYPPPSDPSAFEESEGESVSSAPMHFAVTASIGGASVEMIGPMATCGSGCRRQFRPTLVEEEGAEAEIVIVRFAKFGSAELPDGSAMKWLVLMEDGETLSGPLRMPPQLGEESEGGFPGELSLGGRMVITVQIGDQEPLRLRSRKEPVLNGTVAGWPPYGMELALENGPIPYFPEDSLEDEQAQPLVEVTDNRVLLGTQPHAILGRAPEITAADRGPDGVTLSWTDSAAEVPTDPPITAYHVYRNREIGNLESWEPAGRVAAAETTWIDREAGPGAAEYLVVHAARCPFGYDLEGLLSSPVSVAP